MGHLARTSGPRRGTDAKNTQRVPSTRRGIQTGFSLVLCTAFSASDDAGDGGVRTVARSRWCGGGRMCFSHGTQSPRRAFCRLPCGRAPFSSLARPRTPRRLPPSRVPVHMRPPIALLTLAARESLTQRPRPSCSRASQARRPPRPTRPVAFRGRTGPGRTRPSQRPHLPTRTRRWHPEGVEYSIVMGVMGRDATTPPDVPSPWDAVSGRWARPARAERC